MMNQPEQPGSQQHAERLSRLLKAWEHIRCHHNCDQLLTLSELREIKLSLEHARDLLRSIQRGEVNITPAQS